MSNFAQQVACAHETNYIHFGSGLTGTTHLTVEGTIPLREYDVSRALMGVDVRVKRALGQDVEDVDFHGSGKDAETGRPHEQDIDQSLLNSQISTLLCLSTSEHSTSSSVTISSLVKYLPLGTTDLDIDAQPLCHEYGDDSRQTSTLPLPTNKRLALSPPITVDHVVPSYQDVPVSSRRIHSSSTSLNNAVANARETSEVSTHQASKTTTTISTATRRKSNILRQLLEQSDLDRLQLQHNIAPPHWKEFTSVRQLCSSHVIGESMEGAGVYVYLDEPPRGDQDNYMMDQIHHQVCSWGISKVTLTKTLKMCEKTCKLVGAFTGGNLDDDKDGQSGKNGDTLKARRQERNHQIPAQVCIQDPPSSKVKSMRPFQQCQPGIVPLPTPSPTPPERKRAGFLPNNQRDVPLAETSTLGEYGHPDVRLSGGRQRRKRFSIPLEAINDRSTSNHFPRVGEYLEPSFAQARPGCDHCRNRSLICTYGNGMDVNGAQRGPGSAACDHCHAFGLKCSLYLVANSGSGKARKNQGNTTSNLPRDLQGQVAVKSKRKAANEDVQEASRHLDSLKTIFSTKFQHCSSTTRFVAKMHQLVERMRQDVVDDERQRPRKHRRRK